MKTRNLVISVWIVILIALVCATVFAACGPPPQGEPGYIPGLTTFFRYTDVPNGLYRFHDKEAGVVCWIFDGQNEVGMQCLPEGETKLGGSAGR